MFVIRTRIARRLGAVLVVVLSLGMIAGGVVTAAGAVAERPEFADPAFRAAVKQAAEARKQRVSERASGAAKARRARSRSAFRGRMGTDAIELARQKFARILQAPVFFGKRQFGARAEEFLNDHTLVVDNGEGQPKGLVQSSIPMRARRDGQSAAVDLKLEEDSEAFRPRTPLVDVRLGRRPADALEVVGRGVGVQIASEPSASAASVVDDRVFFADVAADTDAWVAPAALGAEIFWQLRSPASPERLGLKLQLPPGATTSLVQPPPRANAPLGADRSAAAVQIRHGSEVLATIAPPVAFDADDEPVNVHYELRGNELEVVAAHRDADVEYPLLVDPYVYDQYGFGDTNFQGGWGAESNKGDHFWWDTYHASGGWEHGLHIGQHGGLYYTGEYANYSNWAPGQTSYIYGLEMQGVHHRMPDPQNLTQNFYSGLTDAGGWQSLNNYNATFYWGHRGHCADGRGTGNNWPGNPAFCDASPRPHNRATFGAWINDYGWRTSQGHMIVRDTRMYMSDPEAPRDVSVSNLPPSGWRDDATYTSNVSASDPGLGIRNLYVVRADNGAALGSHHPGSGTCGSRYSRCAASGAWPVTYSTNGLPEGVNALRGRATDAVEHTATSAGTFDVRVDRTAPTLDVTGPLREQTASNPDTSGRDLFPLHIVARDGSTASNSTRRAGVDHVVVRVRTGTQVDEVLRETTLATCADSCEIVIDDLVIDTDWYDEGTHEVEVSACDRLGHCAQPVRWTIVIPRNEHYAQALAAWRADVERRVDEEVPVVPLTGPMPTPPADWDAPGSCDASEAALRACYDRVQLWGRAIHDWLEDNLPAGGASDLPEPPTFEYSLAEDTGLALSRRIRDEFRLAIRAVKEPLSSVNVAIGFHAPLDPTQLSALLPFGGVQPAAAVTGIFDPGFANLQGTMSTATADLLPSIVERFYAKQLEMATRDIAELEQETAADAEEAEDIQASLAEHRAFRDHLSARRPFVKGIALRLPMQQVVILLADTGNAIKSVKLLADDANVASAGSEALAVTGTDRGRVATAGRMRPSSSGGVTTAASGRREESCFDRRQDLSAMPRRILEPNPVYWAPSRHKADTELADVDGDRHLKEHRLRFRWATTNGLQWLCRDVPGDRNFEIEARVYPDDGDRWSTNWESNSAYKYTQHNFEEGDIHQDDVAAGRQRDGDPDFGPQRYPDFAIITSAAAATRYRKLYKVNFTTNGGLTDQGRVIYSAQATQRAEQKPHRDYCSARSGDYKSCMFGTTTVCYNRAFIVENPVYRRVAWASILGDAYSIREIRRDSRYNGQLDPEEPAQPQVITHCDPKPPNADRE